MEKFISDHKEGIIVGTIVFVIMLLIMILVAVGTSKSENMKVPWGHKGMENYTPTMFSGDLSPAQQALYHRLANSDPVNSKHAMAKSEYL